MGESSSTISGSSIERTSVEVRAVDGFVLAATRFRGAPTDANTPRGLVLVNSAVGVKQSYYRGFAEYLVERGFEVVTYDYRAIGQSQREPVHRSAARMQDWGLLDQPALVAQCRQWTGDRPLVVVGHSVGGQILGLAPNACEVAALVGICAQHTWWRLWPKRAWPKLWLLWNVVMPGVSGAMGYFPSPWFGLGQPLPSGVARDWAHWARSPRHIIGALGESTRAGYEHYTGAIRAYSFSDDTFAPPRTVEQLLAVYRAARREHRSVDPSEVGQTIGHFGFFRPVFRDSLWSEAADWIASECEKAE